MNLQSSLFNFSKFNVPFSGSLNRFCAVAATVGAAGAISLGGVSPAMAGTLVRDDSGFVTRIEGLEVGEEAFDVDFLAGAYNSLVAEGITFDLSIATEEVGQAIVEILGDSERTSLFSGSIVRGVDDVETFENRDSDGFFLPSSNGRFAAFSVLGGGSVFLPGFQDRNQAVEEDELVDTFSFSFIPQIFAVLSPTDLPQEVPAASMLPAVLTVAAAALGKRKLARSENT